MSAYRISRDKFLSEVEMSTLLKICEESTIVDLAKGRKTWVTRYMLVHLVFNTGLRVSEIAALKIGDLSLKGRDTFLIVRNGKGGRRRDVYLDKKLVRHIGEYISHKAKAWGQSTSPDSPLFSSGGRKHYTTTALQLSFKRAIEKADLPTHYSIHSARHTYATILLAKTSNLRFVQKQLGHASINMTALYADVLPEMNQRLANAILE